MNLIGGKNSRMALSAAFAILTSRLMRLLLFGDKYWSFPRMDDPEFADKLSFLSSKVDIDNEAHGLQICSIKSYYIPFFRLTKRPTRKLINRTYNRACFHTTVAYFTKKK